MLVRHLPALGLTPGARVFVPLCGKSLDIGWLLGEGYRAVGAELVENAVQQLFEGLGVEPAIEDAGPLKRYRAEGLDIFVGDLFDVSAALLGAVDAVYDRAALVALPAETRPRYAAHIADVADRAPQLLVTFDYEQTQMAGPPFAVSEEEVRRLTRTAYEVELLQSAEVEGGLKGFCPSIEQAWRLKPLA